METYAEGLDVATGTRRKLPPDAVLLKDAGCWPGVHIEEWLGADYELPDTALFEHGVVLNLTSVTKREISWDGGHRVTGPFGARSLGILPAAVPYRLRSQGAWRCVVLGLSPALVESIAGRRVVLPPRYGFYDDYVAQSLLALLADVRDDHSAGSIYGETVGAALAMHLVRRYQGHTAGVAAPRAPRRDREKIRELIMDRLAEPLSLAEMAAYLELDVYRFARWFKEAFGISPHRYVVLARVERAKSRLADRDTTLAELALECGFNSQSHLSTTFRRIVGDSPHAYRLRVTGDGRHRGR